MSTRSKYRICGIGIHRLVVISEALYVGMHVIPGVAHSQVRTPAIHMAEKGATL